MAREPQYVVLFVQTDDLHRLFAEGPLDSAQATKLYDETCVEEVIHWCGRYEVDGTGSLIYLEGQGETPFA